jgi:hypothetical protein
MGELYGAYDCPNPGGLTWNITGEANATPMNEIETES